jgi:large subunit ribosomal protein L6
VQVDINGSFVKVKGPKGEMKRDFSPLIDIALENGQINITRRSDEAAQRALHGTTRAVLHNMVYGVSTGFNKILEWDGVGYRAEMSGSNLMLYMGYSHPVTVEPPTGLSFEVDAKTRQIKVSGFDKEVVGQVASNIRKVRPVEPYLGKGLHYLGEKVRRKAGKSGKGKK